jgi:hypothetical protein
VTLSGSGGYAVGGFCGDWLDALGDWRRRALVAGVGGVLGVARRTLGVSAASFLDSSDGPFCEADTREPARELRTLVVDCATVDVGSGTPAALLPVLCGAAWYEAECARGGKGGRTSIVLSGGMGPKLPHDEP